MLLDVVLCPSDQKKPIQSKFAPTNYVACTGADERASRATNGNSNSNGLSQRLNLGIWRRTMWHKLADVKDGTSNTLAISECKLVVDDSVDLSTLEQLEQFYGHACEHWLLQPCMDDRHEHHRARTLELIRTRPRWRLSVQLHKIMGVP